MVVEKKFEKTILSIVVVACVVAIGVSVSDVIIPKPDPWLVEWTAWLGTVVTIVVAARVFWIGGNTLHTLLTKGLPRRKKQ